MTLKTSSSVTFVITRTKLNLLVKPDKTSRELSTIWTGTTTVLNNAKFQSELRVFSKFLMTKPFALSGCSLFWIGKTRWTACWTWANKFLFALSLKPHVPTGRWWVLADICDNPDNLPGQLSKSVSVNLHQTHPPSNQPNQAKRMSKVVTQNVEYTWESFRDNPQTWTTQQPGWSLNLFTLWFS